MSLPHLLPNGSPSSSFLNVLAAVLIGNGSSLPSTLDLDSSAWVGVAAAAPRSSSELVPRSTVGWVSGGSHNNEGLPTVLGTNVGGLDAKILVGGFVPPKLGVFDPVLDLDTLATVAGASDDLPAAVHGLTDHPSSSGVFCGGWNISDVNVSNARISVLVDFGCHAQTFVVVAV
ncbi:hypothetical protein SUGI_0828460 [Cryptomeria japonica]|nr:hypothetical protein SUGI_0828460 [Cryptomeria japonica]